MPPQLSFEPILFEPPSKRSIFGSAIAPGTLNGETAIVGPIARIKTVLAVVPAITNPVVIKAPDPTPLSTDALIRRGDEDVTLVDGVAS